MAYFSKEVELSTDADFDIYPDEYWNECDEGERRELKELVCDYFNIIDPALSLVDAVVERLGVGEDSVEVRDFIRRTIEEMEYKLKMRDFS